MRNAKTLVYDQWYVHEGKGQVVLLLHGLFGNLKMWSRTVEALKNNYRVIIPRLPLFDLPADRTNLLYLVDVLDSFISLHNLTDVVIVGHGMGGQLALLYTYTHPQNVSRLVISGSTGFMSDPYLTDSALTNELDYEFVEERVQAAFFRSALVPKKLVEQVFSTVQSTPRRRSMEALIKSSDKSDMAILLNRIDHPVLILWGLEDKITPPEVALHFHDFLQNSVVHFIEQCGHVPMVERSETYNWHLVHFLEA